MNVTEYLTLFKANAKTLQVFNVLRDERWHCRNHEYEHISIGQLAGSGGIQGLQRGSTKRVGIGIESEDKFCEHCNRNYRHDRWNGTFRSIASPSNMSKTFEKRVIKLLDSKDVVDNTVRPPPELTIDHKLPMIRWSKNTEKYQTNYKDMTDSDIKRAFQLLKKSNGSVSHNLLKSRYCESCFETKKRGEPFGIKFFWSGDENWNVDNNNPDGCIGCGWYDFAKWRNELNKFIQKNS